MYRVALIFGDRITPTPTNALMDKNIDPDLDEPRIPHNADQHGPHASNPYLPLKPTRPENEPVQNRHQVGTG